ncbi:DNA-binding transcriptional regulator Fis [Pokkaliibacter plantistimulans]|uniref:Putative Fis-like DNA-binding protein n=2 Tax=Pseudomonadota TaxID=1224 RepID=A0A2S5KX42_9PROT|nr:DNA-binding transcriptional regulator Fis [Pokkaliibacter plantistimulans]
MALTKLNTQDTLNESPTKVHTAVVPQETAQTLRDTVARSLDNYFKQLDGQPVSDVYEMVLAEIEQPLFETVMHYTKDNQTKASQVLGLNRGTLRKKLKQYGLL